MKRGIEQNILVHMEVLTVYFSQYD